MINPLTVEKLSNISEAVVSDIVTYSIKITNTTGVIINQINIKDLLSPDLNFIEGSVYAGNINIPNGNILSGVNVGNLGVGSEIIVTFKAEIVSKSGKLITNKSTVTFNYIDPDEGINKIAVQDSNENQILVEIADLYITKTTDKEEVMLNDVISYRLVIENKGTIDVLNIVLKDIINAPTELVSGSFKVNGVIVNDVNTENGVNIGGLLEGKSITVDYKVKVKGGTCSGFIVNNAYAEYDYVLPDGVTGKRSSNIAQVMVSVQIVSFKQLCLSKNCIIPCEKPDIEEINDVEVDVVIDNSYVINTIKAQSNEGQKLSGKKLIIHGHLNVIIEYTAALKTQPIHSAHCTIPFSTFLILPEDYIDNQYVEIKSVIENLDADAINERVATVNIVFLIIAKTN